MTFDSDESFVAYSLPGSSSFNLVYQNDRKSTPFIEGSLNTFVINSFLGKKENLTSIRAENILIDQSFDVALHESSNDPSTTKSKYLSDVTSIIDDISQGKYQKLVYSRVFKVKRKEHDIYEIYRNLVSANTKAFVFCYYTPVSGCWMGATPELLIEQKDQGYKTTALASTQLDMGLPLDQVQWSPKETEEHQFLNQFIVDRLNSAHVNFEEGMTKTIRAGNVLHIATDFQIDNNSFSIEGLADMLHPGPAISGTPQDVAIDQIQLIESHNRQDYCGYLGPIGIDGVSALFVNLRSMKVFSHSLQLFLGGGITIDSDPEEEWLETKNKSGVLLQSIENLINL